MMWRFSHRADTRSRLIADRHYNRGARRADRELTMPEAKTYDPACYDLAEHFMQDEPCRNDPELYKKYCDSLAKDIQSIVESWFLMPDDYR